MPREAGRRSPNARDSCLIFFDPVWNGALKTDKHYLVDKYLERSNRHNHRQENHLEIEHSMKIHSYVQIVTTLFAGIFFSFSAAAQSADDWNAYKAAHGIDPNMTYNDWRAQQNSSGATPGTPAAPAATFTPQQQMILNAGQAAMPALQQWSHDFFWGKPVDPAQQAALLAAQQEQQQRQLAARQLNKSGIYLLKQKDYLGAINEFQQALAETPNDPDIIRNLALARQKIKDTAVAAQNSGALGQLLGSQPQPVSTTGPNSSPLNLVNFDAKTVDLRRHITPLNSLNVNNDPGAVDFRGVAKPGSTEEEKQNANLRALQRQLNQPVNPIITDSHAVNFSGLGKAKPATSSSTPAPDQQKLQDQLNRTLDSNPAPQPVQSRQKLQDQLNNVLGANFDGQAHN